MAPLTLPEYLEQLGFPDGADPFQSVNATDEKALLGKYFVPPPYYATVWGDPRLPASCIILGPTGGGKTALALRVAQQAAESTPLDDGRLPVLPVMYDDFPELGIDQEHHSLADHMAALNQLLVNHLLLTIAVHPYPALSITDDDRQLLRYAFAKYVGGASDAEVYHALRGIRTPWEVVRDAASDMVSAVTIAKLVANALEMANAKLEAALTIPGVVSQAKKLTRNLDASAQVDFHRLVELATKYYYQAVYFLVDRVDEPGWTQRNPEGAYALVEPIMANLSLLDRPDRHYGFKFFVWDKINAFYESKARPDRIFTEQLRWKREQLLQMVDRRVEVYSDQAIPNLNALFSTHVDLPAEYTPAEVIGVFAGQTPRTVLTLMKKVVKHQVEALNRGETTELRLTERALADGVREFCNDVAVQVIPKEKDRREVTSIRRVTYSSRSLHNEVFRAEKFRSVATRVANWKRYGFSTVYGKLLSGRRGNPAEKHAFTSPPIAFLASGLSIRSFVSDKVRNCPQCDELLLRDFEQGGAFQCHACLQTFDLPRNVTAMQEALQTHLRAASKELTRLVPDAPSIEALSSAASLGFPKTTFQGFPSLIWLRVLQQLATENHDQLLAFLEMIEDQVADDTDDTLHAISDLYYFVSETYLVVDPAQDSGSGG